MAHSNHHPKNHQEARLSRRLLEEEHWNSAGDARQWWTCDHKGDVSLSIKDIMSVPQGYPYVPQAPLLLNPAHTSSTGDTRQRRGQDRLGGGASTLQMCSWQ